MTVGNHKVERASILEAVSDWLKLLALVVLVSEGFLLAAMSLGPADDPLRGYYPLLMLVLLLVVVVGIFVDRAGERRTLAFPPGEPAVPRQESNRTTKWYAEWRLGKKRKLYTEILELEIKEGSSDVTGRRTVTTTEKVDVYEVRGFWRQGFYWLSYFLPGGTGGGTILLQEFTGGKLRGVITSVNCDNGDLRAVANQWVESERRSSFSGNWQQMLGQVSLPGRAEGVGT